MNMPKISVIVPCYKTEPELLQKSIESILNQTFQDLEIIVVDDGNTEEYRSVYETDLFKDERIKLLKKKNEGVSAARNDGVRIAAGDYVVYADSDDVMMKQFLSEAYEIATKNNADLVMGGNIDLNLIDTMKNTKNYPVKTFVGDQIKQLRKYMLGKKRYQFGSGKASVGQGSWTRLVKKEKAVSVMFDTSLPIGEDVVWNLELFKICNKVCVAETVWYGYYYNPTSATRRFRSRAIEESKESMDKIKKYLDLDNDDEYYSYCSRAFVDLHRIHQCFIGNPQNPLSSAQIRKKAKYVYTNEPWNELKSKRYFAMCSKKDKITLLLFRFKLLFSYYSLRDKNNVKGVSHE